MGMRLSTYVGPYFVVPRSVREDVLDKWESLFCESGVGGLNLILVPSREIPGISRAMRVKDGNQGVANIDPEDIIKERDAFVAMATEFLRWRFLQDIPCQVRWGVVPCWS